MFCMKMAHTWGFQQKWLFVEFAILITVYKAIYIILRLTVAGVLNNITRCNQSSTPEVWVYQWKPTVLNGWIKTMYACWTHVMYIIVMYMHAHLTGLKLENYYFFTFTFSRPEVRKLWLFYVFTFSRPEVRKLFRIYVFTFSRPEVGKLFHISKA